jgi:hypothetical protein
MMNSKKSRLHQKLGRTQIKLPNSWYSDERNVAYQLDQPADIDHRRAMQEDGMTASDITIQMKGPYSDATFTTPYGELSKLQIQRARLTINRNTIDHREGDAKMHKNADRER